MTKKLIPLDEIMAELPPEDREQVEARGKELVRAETLRQLRTLAKKNQSQVSGMSQDGVSRLEGRNDMLLSSLNSYVRGLGGTLKLVAELPDVGKVELELTSRTTVK